MGIDEHTIHKGYKFATTIADLSHHRICDVIKGKRHCDTNILQRQGEGEGRLHGFIKRIPKHCKEMLSKCEDCGGQVPHDTASALSFYGILQEREGRSKVEQKNYLSFAEKERNAKAAR